MNRWNSTFKAKKPVQRKFKRMKGIKKPKQSTLKAKLDRIYSLYVRKSQSDDSGQITCYCGVRVHWSESDNSHYIPRGSLSTRYDPRNTHASCRRCNRYMGGNLQQYALYLRRKYGDGILESLDQEKRKIVKNFPYEALIAEYTQKLAEMTSSA